MDRNVEGNVDAERNTILGRLNKNVHIEQDYWEECQILASRGTVVEWQVDAHVFNEILATVGGCASI